jgi:hypothetical protein
MTTISPTTLALLGRAAHLRASGRSWADAAAQLAVGQDELRRLAYEHSRDYDRLSRRARNEVLRESMDEAVGTLRRLLGSEDPDVGRMAAVTLVRYTMARMRQDLNAGGERPPKPRKITVEAENVRAENSSELAKVTKRQDVDAAKKVAQPHPQPPATRVPSPPAVAQPPATAPAPATPAASPAAPGTAPAPTPAHPATPPPAAKPSDAELLRRKRLLNAAVLGQPLPPLSKDAPVPLEVDRLLRGWLADGK